MRKNPFISLAPSGLLLSGCTSARKKPSAFAANSPQSQTGSIYTPPAAPCAVYNFNPGGKFVFGDLPGAQVTTGDNGNPTTNDKPFRFSTNVPEGNFEHEIR